MFNNVKRFQDPEGREEIAVKPLIQRRIRDHGLGPSLVQTHCQQHTDVRIPNGRLNPSRSRPSVSSLPSREI